MTPLRWSLLLGALLAAGCNRSGSGADAYRAERFEEALAAYSEEVTAAGADASAVLLHNRALAGLRAGDLGAAERAAEEATVRGGSAVTARCAFLRGNVAFARSEQAAEQATTPEAEPFAFDVAIAHARTARGHWVFAATRVPDWKEARRNAERAVLLIGSLEKLKATKQRQKAKQENRRTPVVLPDPSAENTPRADPAGAPRTSGGSGAATGQGGNAQAATRELSAGEILALMDTLADKEAEKLHLRKLTREARKAGVEKDW